MAAKLTEITTQYHTFVDDQVLTKDQLNGFISYFEDQDRLTRAFLHGVGTVCGFKLKNATISSITITQGVGVTTDGDLITLRQPVSAGGVKSIELEEQVLTHFRKFEDKFAAYPFFRRVKTVDSKTTTELIEMWELFPEAVENSTPLVSLANLKDKTVLLYLESYAKEGDLCTTIDCDNQGVEQVARLRILLVSKQDAEYIAKNDSIFSKYDVAQKFTELPEPAVRRVVLNQLNTANYNALKLAYHTALNSNGLQTTLTDGIAKLNSGFGNLLQLEPLKNQFNKFPENLKKLIGFTSANIPFDFQYRYDLVKDLVDTWNEIRCLLLSLKEVCFPDINAFPKHLLLGNLDEVNVEPKQNRHAFYKSPALTCGLSKLNQCRSLIHRFFEMIDGYGSKSGEVKITPSNKLPELSFRSVPFYFKVDEKLLRVWDFLKTEKFSHTKNLSYSRENLSGLPQIQDPLNFNTDRFDFLRIEGHQGKNYKTALEEILDLKTKHGLAFDVKALSVNVNTENLNIDDYECEFEDLNMLLRAWTAEQECVLAEVSKLFSGFNTAEPGKNVRENLVAVRKVTESTLNLLSNARDASGSTRIRTNVDASKVTAEKQTKEQKIFNTYYTTSNVIPDNLATEENTLGILMKTAFDDTQGGSVNDIIARANKLVTENVDQAVWAEQPEMKEFIIDQSIELMAYTHVLSQRMPNVLVNVNVLQVDSYKLTLKELCALVDKLKVRYQKIELSSNLKALMGVLVTHLSGICCSAKKLEILLEEINKRKENIILRLRLSEFIKHHPGLEHKAGVEPGGTFVLVYLNKIQPEPERDVNLTRFDVADNLRITEAKTLSSRDSANRVNDLEKYAEFLKMEKQSSDVISKIEMFIAEERFRLFEKVQTVAEIPNNTVVADFSLPYLCCSDCAPVNFIIQKPPAWLRLEKDKICLGQDTEVRFEVSPEDGDIQSDPEVPGMTIENKKITFDPAVFPDELFGKSIKFTVNQQVTEAELIVFKAPEVDFEAPEKAPVNLEITFEPFGDIEGVFFLWDFGDGSPASNVRIPKHRYTKLPDNEDNSVVVKLVVTAANGVCTATAEHKIDLFEIIIEVNLEGRDFCENDESSHPFGVGTAGASVTIDGPGVEQDSTGNFVFIPAKAGKGEHTFNVNGEPSEIVVTVHEAPAAKFEPGQDGDKMILTNFSTGADSFIWIINEEEIERDDNSPLVIELKPDSPTRYILQLIAVSKHCGRVESDKIRFETKPVEPPVDNCIEVITAAILKDLDNVKSLNLPSSNFVVPIWMSTSQLYGGADEFKEGVLNDLENFLTGNNNEKLPELFLKLLVETSNMIIELSGNPDSQEYQHLVQLFALQLQLFYNILACQSTEVLEKFRDILARMFELIISILQHFREREIKLHETLRAFMEKWAEKVAGKEILEEHVKFILDNNLV